MNRGLRRWPLARQVLDRDAFALGATAASARTSDLRPRTETARLVDGVCPYCATGCTLRVAVDDGRIVDIEGDERSPVSRGRLCPKGQATLQFVAGSHRLDRVLYRPPGGTEWETLGPDEAMDMVADRFFEARDRTWQATDDAGRPLNRTTGIGVVGGATLDNEESYLMRKLLTAAGVFQMDNQARICHSPTPAGLGTTWGRGGPGSTFGLEVSSALRFDGPGVLGMARSTSPTSNGSQFYLTLAATPNLDGQYTVFGRVLGAADLAVLDQVARGEPPASPSRITSVSILVGER